MLIKIFPGRPRSHGGQGALYIDHGRTARFGGRVGQPRKRCAQTVRGLGLFVWRFDIALVKPVDNIFEFTGAGFKNSHQGAA